MLGPVEVKYERWWFVINGFVLFFSRRQSIKQNAIYGNTSNISQFFWEQGSTTGEGRAVFIHSIEAKRPYDGESWHTTKRA